MRLLRDLPDRHFVLVLASVAVLAAALPGLLISASAPTGTSYIGHVYNTDDHMVYAAWMRQAMEGRFFFDNRFTTDPQPGLTVHLYFYGLGLLANVFGIAGASNLARIVFSFLFVVLLYRLVRRLSLDQFGIRMATAVPLVAAGLGFLVWHTFGQAIVNGSPFEHLMLGRLPVDVWQPEVFVYPSMLSNGLFMVSLCLLVTIFSAVLQARESKPAVLFGALAMLLLMNIHSYDVLLIALTLVGFLAAAVAQKHADRTWIGRVTLIGAGALPSAAWFLYVLQNDPVFRARAATETYSPNFVQVFFGLFLPIVFGLVGLALRTPADEAERKRWNIGLRLTGALLGGMLSLAPSHQSGYFMSPAGWIFTFIMAVVAVSYLSDKRPAMNLVISWALVGLVAIYFPALFQRKLAMGLAVPWSILASMGLLALVQKQEAGSRRMLIGLGVLLMGASSIRWAARELHLAGANVSNTTVHPVYLSADMQRIFEYLNKQAGKKTLIALPGVPSAVFRDNRQESAPASELTPMMPDLNPIASGLTGVYTYAGHWSETPDYGQRRNEVTKLFLGNLPEAERQELLRKTGAQYVLSPSLATGLYDFSQLGEVVVDGEQFRLVRLRN